MSTVIDVSSKLGEYMLKGWVLTDEICSKCRKVPLMRSPSAPTSYFCANCDSTPSAPSAVAASSSRAAVIDHPHPTRKTLFQPHEQQSSPSSASSSHPSRSSTPPTEISSTPSSPMFGLPVPTEEILRRRQQSDTASAEIGKRMLKGWAMLADECPNSGCYGIPLVRPPKADGEKDPRKECVICGTVYIDQEGPSAQSRLVPLNPMEPSGASPGRFAVTAQPAASTSVASPVLSKGKAVDRHGLQAPSSSVTVQAPYFTHPAATTSSALEASAQSLELSLHTLSDRLKLLAGGPVVDPSSIAQTADAISKVSQALTQVKQLQWSETQALGA